MNDSQSLREFCHALPKVELHAHITGSIRDDFFKELIERRKQKDNSFEAEDAEEIINKPTSRTLIECFKLFRVVQSLIPDLETMYEVTRKVISDFAAEGVVYLELRTTPRELGHSACTKEEHISCILRAIHDEERNSESLIAVRLLISIDRSYGAEMALKTVEMANRMRKNNKHGNYVVGIDLSGNPFTGSHVDYVPALELAKSYGFKLGLHIAETKDRNEEILELLRTSPDRIGHGTYLHPSVGGTSEMLDLVISNKIPLELCLTSNVKCVTVSAFENHQMGYWKSINHPFVICTDDKGVFQTTLTDELEIASKVFGLTKKDIFDMTLNAVDYCFCEDDVKSQLRSSLKKWSTKIFVDACT